MKETNSNVGGKLRVIIENKTRKMTLYLEDLSPEPLSDRFVGVSGFIELDGLQPLLLKLSKEIVI